MYITILLVVLVLLFTCLVWWDTDLGEAIVVLFCSGMVAVLAGFIVSVGVSESTYSQEDARVVTRIEQPLAALSLGSEIKGNFFLGSGYIEGELHYSYAVQEESGGYRLSQVKASRVLVFEGSDDPMRVEVTTEGPTSPWAWFTAMRTETQFHVPTGTIVQQYSIDVEGL